MSTLVVGTLKGVSGSLPPVVQNSSGTEIGYFAKAWIVFDGTGTVSITDDKNVTTLTDVGTGIYRVTFTNAMPSANYVPVGIGQRQSGNSDVRVMAYDANGSPPWNTTQFEFEMMASTGDNPVDSPKCAISFIG